MPRRRRRRRVGKLPEREHFKPVGIPLRELDEVILKVEEYEALRLKDSEQLPQKECADHMRISQPTFHRLLRGAREKISKAIVSGKAIRIEGGNYRLRSK